MFFGWGLLLAISSVFAAPGLKRRFGVVKTLGAMYVALALILAIMGFGTGSPALLAVAVIAAGAVLGVVNTVLTEAVMRVAPVERPIASSAYSFVRFAGGAVAPWLAGKLAEWVAPDTPFFVGAAAVLVALGVLVAGRAYFAEEEEFEVATATPVAPVLVAVDGSSRGIEVTAAAARLAAERGAGVEVVHVHETDVVGEEAVDRESREMAAPSWRCGSRSCERRESWRAVRSCTPTATARTPCARSCPGSNRSARRPWSSAGADRSPRARMCPWSSCRHSADRP